MLNEVIAPTYAKLIIEASRLLGNGPEFYGLWPTLHSNKPWDSLVTHFYQYIVKFPVFYSKVFGGKWLSINDVITVPMDTTDREKLCDIMIKEGMAISDLPIELVKVIEQLTQPLVHLEPSRLRSQLGRPGEHPYLSNISDMTVILRYFLTKLRGKVLGTWVINCVDIHFCY